MTVNDGTPNQNDRRDVWAKNRLYVTLSRTGSGGMRFEGQDLNPNPFGDSDYEYALTVERDDIPMVIEKLGGKAGDDVLDIVEANMDVIMQKGELTWLKSIGITPGFWNRF